jgi:hypothetical protein
MGVQGHFYFDEDLRLEPFYGHHGHVVHDSTHSYSTRMLGSSAHTNEHVIIHVYLLSVLQYIWMSHTQEREQAGWPARNTPQNTLVLGIIVTNTKPKSFHAIVPTCRQHIHVQESAMLIFTATTQARLWIVLTSWFDKHFTQRWTRQSHPHYVVLSMSLPSHVNASKSVPFTALFCTGYILSCSWEHLDCFFFTRNLWV